MFSETSYPTCKDGETLTQTASGWVCLTQAQWEAQESGDKPDVYVSAKPEDAWTNYLIYGGLALLAVVLVTGGRRR